MFIFIQSFYYLKTPRICVLYNYWFSVFRIAKLIWWNIFLDPNTLRTVWNKTLDCCSRYFAAYLPWLLRKFANDDDIVFKTNKTILNLSSILFSFYWASHPPTFSVIVKVFVNKRFGEHKWRKCSLKWPGEEITIHYDKTYMFIYLRLRST